MTLSTAQLPKRRVVLLTVFVFAVSALLAQLPVLRDFGLRLTDSYLRTVPPPHTPPRPVLVLIDDESLAAEGRWPWSRTKLADLISRLSRAGAQVVGVDILLPEAQSPQPDEQLAEAIRESGRVILVDKIAWYGDGQVHWVEPLPQFLEAAAGIGHAHAVLDADGVCRRFPALEISIEGERVSLGIAAALQVDRQATSRFLSHYGIVYDRDAGVVAAAPELVPIPYRRDPFTTLSAKDVLRGRNLELVRGRPALVGFGSSDLGDRLTTPLTTSTPTPGVEVHAQILDAALSERVLKALPGWLSYVLLLLTAFASVVLFRRMRRWTAIVVIAALAAACYFAGWLAYALSSRMLNPGPLLIALVLAPLMVQADHLFEVNRQLAGQVDDLRMWLRRHGWSSGPYEDDLAANVAVLQQLQSELGSLYELHDNLLQASTDAIAVFDTHGRLLLQNRLFASLFGLTPRGGTMDEFRLELHWTEDAPEIATRSGQEGEARVADELFSVRTLPISATRLSPGGGSLVLLTSLKTREERDASRAEALGFVTHELRAPLTSIQGFAELMMQYPESPACEEAPRIIYRESKRLLALIHSYLDVLRIDAGARPIQTSTFAIREVVDNLLQLLRPAADEVGMTLLPEGDPTLPLTADRPLLEGAMLNLLTNAIKYGTPGGTVVVKWDVAGEQAALTVRNPSKGVSGAELSSMVEPFRRGANVQDKTGWGIGLALVRRIAEKHGGHLDGQVVDGNVSFSILIPVQHDSAMAAEGAR